MKNKLLCILLVFFVFIPSCNMPGQRGNSKTEPEPETVSVIWDLGVSGNSNTASDPENISGPKSEQPTATPQLVKAINFDDAFSSVYQAEISENRNTGAAGTDSAQWLYFSPGEFTSDPLETLYTAFMNSGESVWTTDYSLQFYAGMNPSKSEFTALDKTVYPGEQAVFSIPITTSEANWKACWYLLSSSGESLYDFCYSHGSGVNPSSAESAQNTSAGSNSADTGHPFYKHEGSAPAKFSNEELSAEFLSTSPSTGHDFKAYDHYEELSASFQNNGSAVWDSSYSLVFYAGYNWMHTNSFSLPGSVGPGETATVTMPMEIYEDNDRWFTCWYLSTPDGKNLADFCFNYFTSS